MVDYDIINMREYEKGLYIMWIHIFEIGNF